MTCNMEDSETSCEILEGASKIFDCQEFPNTDDSKHLHVFLNMLREKKKLLGEENSRIRRKIRGSNDIVRNL